MTTNLVLRLEVANIKEHQVYINSRSQLVCRIGLPQSKWLAELRCPLTLPAANPTISPFFILSTHRHTHASTHALQLVQPPLTTGCLFVWRNLHSAVYRATGSLWSSQGWAPHHWLASRGLLGIAGGGGGGRRGLGDIFKELFSPFLWAMEEWSVITCMMESWARPTTHCPRLSVNIWHPLQL